MTIVKNTKQAQKRKLKGIKKQAPKKQAPKKQAPKKQEDKQTHTQTQHVIVNINKDDIIQRKRQYQTSKAKSSQIKKIDQKEQLQTQRPLISSSYMMASNQPYRPSVYDQQQVKGGITDAQLILQEIKNLHKSGIVSSSAPKAKDDFKLVEQALEDKGNEPIQIYNKQEELDQKKLLEQMEKDKMVFKEFGQELAMPSLTDKAEKIALRTAFDQLRFGGRKKTSLSDKERAYLGLPQNLRNLREAGAPPKKSANKGKKD